MKRKRIQVEHAHPKPRVRSLYMQVSQLLGPAAALLPSCPSSVGVRQEMLCWCYAAPGPSRCSSVPGSEYPPSRLLSREAACHGEPAGIRDDALRLWPQGSAAGSRWAPGCPQDGLGPRGPAIRKRFRTISRTSHHTSSRAGPLFRRPITCVSPGELQRS